MNLTKEDIELLKYLHAVKVANYRQISRDIYPSYHLRSVKNRLAKLERLALVTGIQDRRYSNGEKIISISKSGFQQFVARGHELRCELRSEAIIHDLQLVDIRSRFLNLEAVSDYLTENQVQTWGMGDRDFASAKVMNLRSDALAKIAFPTCDILAAIEYELSEKALRRYDSIVKKYYLCDEIGVVFFICTSNSLVRKVAEAERSFFPGDQPKFFYQVIHDFLQSDAATFKNCNGFPLNFATKRPGDQVMIT